MMPKALVVAPVGKEHAIGRDQSKSSHGETLNRAMQLIRCALLDSLRQHRDQHNRRRFLARAQVGVQPSQQHMKSHFVRYTPKGYVSGAPLGVPAGNGITAVLSSNQT